MQNYLLPLHKALMQHADPEKAIPMQEYMRNKFQYLGIKAPQRKEILKTFLQAYGLPSLEQVDAISRDLWEMPEREYQYVAMGILERMKKKLTAEFITTIEHLILTKSWWDTVDMLASHNVGTLFANHPAVREEYVAKWRVSDNIWLRRATLLFQLKYKANTDIDLLFALIEENRDSDEFFIQKAIGWVLREYSKVDNTAVIDYVAKTNLAPLSEREALKWMQNKGIIK